MLLNAFTNAPCDMSFGTEMRMRAYLNFLHIGRIVDKPQAFNLFI